MLLCNNCVSLVVLGLVFVLVLLPAFVFVLLTSMYCHLYFNFCDFIMNWLCGWVGNGFFLVFLCLLFSFVLSHIFVFVFVAWLCGWVLVGLFVYCFPRPCMCICIFICISIVVCDCNFVMIVWVGWWCWAFCFLFSSIFPSEWGRNS